MGPRPYGVHEVLSHIGHIRYYRILAPLGSGAKYITSQSSGFNTNYGDYGWYGDLVELDVTDILEDYTGLTAHEYAVRICELFGIPFNSAKLNARPVKSCVGRCKKHDYKNHITMDVEDLVVVDVKTLLFYIMNNLDGYDEWSEKHVKNEYYEGRGRMHRQNFYNLYSFCEHKKIAWFSKVNQRRQQVKLDKAKAEEEGTNK